MFLEWYKRKDKNESSEFNVDTEGLKNWIVLVNRNGGLSFYNVNCDLVFTITKEDRKGYYKIYRNGKYISKVRDINMFADQIWDKE